MHVYSVLIAVPVQSSNLVFVMNVRKEVVPRSHADGGPNHWNFFFMVQVPRTTCLPGPSAQALCILPPALSGGSSRRRGRVDLILHFLKEFVITDLQPHATNSSNVAMYI